MEARITEQLTAEANHIYSHGHAEAIRLHHREIHIEHLVLGMLYADSETTARILHTAGVEYETMRQVAVKRQDAQKPWDNQATLAKDSLRLLQRAVKVAHRDGQEQAQPEHLLLALAQSDDAHIVRVLQVDGVDMDLIAHLARRSLNERDDYDVKPPLVEKMSVRDKLKRLIGR
ncbi:MAG: hypothetical protein D6737_08120 [Chloroflexi bacterium]|nr:MAG: hypothetical protein D6737_08120 [Chloroflexota bacterium]